MAKGVAEGGEKAAAPFNRLAGSAEKQLRDREDHGIGAGGCLPQLL